MLFIEDREKSQFFTMNSAKLCGGGGAPGHTGLSLLSVQRAERFLLTINESQETSRSVKGKGRWQGTQNAASAASHAAVPTPRALVGPGGSSKFGDHL